jgi:hypothetical protein
VKLACLALLFCIGFAPMMAHAADPAPATTAPQATLEPREFIRLKPNVTPPVTCDADHIGTVAADSTGELCSCIRLAAVNDRAAFGWAGVPARMVQCGFRTE